MQTFTSFSRSIQLPFTTPTQSARQSSSFSNAPPKPVHISPTAYQEVKNISPKSNLLQRIWHWLGYVEQSQLDSTRTHILGHIDQQSSSLQTFINTKGTQSCKRGKKNQITLEREQSRITSLTTEFAKKNLEAQNADLQLEQTRQTCNDHLSSTITAHQRRAHTLLKRHKTELRLALNTHRKELHDLQLHEEQRNKFFQKKRHSLRAKLMQVQKNEATLKAAVQELQNQLQQAQQEIEPLKKNFAQLAQELRCTIIEAQKREALTLQHTSAFILATHENITTTETSKTSTQTFKSLGASSTTLTFKPIKK